MLYISHPCRIKFDANALHLDGENNYWFKGSMNNQHGEPCGSLIISLALETPKGGAKDESISSLYIKSVKHFSTILELLLLF